MGYYLLTGATGLLGRYLMRNLLLAGADLAVLVRPSRRKDPADRIESAMRVWDEQLGFQLPRPVVLTGDISRPDLGLCEEETKWASENCDVLMHNAASLSFVTTGRHSEPWRSNVEGTKNVLDFCQQASIDNFFHVSTAYVAGKRTGRVYESELRVGQEFGNCYEESKVEAEELVRGCRRLSSLTVFRPAIIIGDSQTGMTTTYHNYYAMLQLAQTLAVQLCNVDLTGVANGSQAHFNVDGTERKNLVPVDWVADVMTHILLHPECHGQTYHLTPRVPVTTRLMRDVIEQAVPLYGVEFYGAGERRSDSTEMEDLFHEHMRVYSSYWRDDPAFDTANTQKACPHLPCPHIDREMLLRLSRAAIASRFNWRDPVVERRAAVHA